MRIYNLKFINLNGSLFNEKSQMEIWSKLTMFHEFKVVSRQQTLILYSNVEIKNGILNVETKNSI